MFIIRILIALFFTVLFCTCSYNKYKELLVGGNGFYWDVVQDGNRKFSIPRYSYFFGKSGGCVYYAYMKYPDKPIKRVKFDYGDVVYPNTWELKSDTLKIQGFQKKIISLTQNKITLIELNDSKDTIVLVKSIFKE